MPTIYRGRRQASYALFGTDAYDLGYIAARKFSFGTAAVPAGGLLLLAGLGELAALRKRRT